jgi:hypothetical protein
LSGCGAVGCEGIVVVSGCESSILLANMWICGRGENTSCHSFMALEKLTCKRV